MLRIVLASLLVVSGQQALAQSTAASPAAPPAASSATSSSAAPPQLDPVSTIASIDTNHDGAASREEWVAHGFHDNGFTNIDTDKDGRLTVAELRVFRAARAKTDAEKAALQAENPVFDVALTILMADSDRDGAVSEAEWVAYGNHGGRGFASVDANGDGKITAAELTAYRDARNKKK